MQINKKWLVIGGAVILGLAVIVSVYFFWRDWQKKHPAPVEPFVATQQQQDDGDLTPAEHNFQIEAAIEPPTPETRVVGMPVVSALTQIVGGAKIIGASAAGTQQSFNLVVPKNMGEIDTNDLIYALNNAGLVLKGRTDSTSTGEIAIQGAAMSGKDAIDWEMVFTTSSNSVIVKVGR